MSSVMNNGEIITTLKLRMHNDRTQDIFFTSTQYWNKITKPYVSSALANMKICFYLSKIQNDIEQ